MGAKSTRFHSDLLEIAPQSRRRIEEAHDLFITHRNGENVDAGKLLQHFIFCGYIMAENIKLEQIIVNRVKVKVGGYNIRILSKNLTYVKHADNADRYSKY